MKHEPTHTTADSTAFRARGIRIQWKPMLWFVRGDERFFDRQVVDFIQSTRPSKELHPWAQSATEAEYYIKNLTMSEHAVVFDPFLGSGAFAFPAIKLGRYFIGMEIDRGIFEAATNYIMKETMPSSSPTTIKP